MYYDRCTKRLLKQMEVSYPANIEHNIMYELLAQAAKYLIRCRNLAGHIHRVRIVHKITFVNRLHIKTKVKRGLINTAYKDLTLVSIERRVVCFVQYDYQIMFQIKILGEVNDVNENLTQFILKNMEL